jgi:hypothetical protein
MAQTTATKHALLYTLGVKYYSTSSCYTEQNLVLFSTRVLVLFSIFEMLGVVLTDTEYGSVVLSIFQVSFNLWCRIIFYTYGVE